MKMHVLYLHQFFFVEKKFMFDYNVAEDCWETSWTLCYWNFLSWRIYWSSRLKFSNFTNDGAEKLALSASHTLEYNVSWRSCEVEGKPWIKYELSFDFSRIFINVILIMPLLENCDTKLFMLSLKEILGKSFKNVSKFQLIIHVDSINVSKKKSENLMEKSLATKAQMLDNDVNLRWKRLKLNVSDSGGDVKEIYLKNVRTINFEDERERMTKKINLSRFSWHSEHALAQTFLRKPLSLFTDWIGLWGRIPFEFMMPLTRRKKLENEFSRSWWDEFNVSQRINFSWAASRKVMN